LFLPAAEADIAGRSISVPDVGPSDETERFNEELTGSNHSGAAAEEAGASPSVVMDWTISENKEWVVIGFNI